MQITQAVPVAIIAIVVLSSCYKEYETTRSSTTKNISSFLTKMAKEYSPMINATVDHIEDTLVFRCQATTRFIPNLDTFKFTHFLNGYTLRPQLVAPLLYFMDAAFEKHYDVALEQQKMYKAKLADIENLCRVGR